MKMISKKPKATKKARMVISNYITFLKSASLISNFELNTWCREYGYRFPDKCDSETTKILFDRLQDRFKIHFEDCLIPFTEDSEDEDDEL